MSVVEKRIVSLGFPYVEGKIHSSHLHLPESSDKLPVFLDSHPEADLFAGGSIPNVLTSFVRLSDELNVEMFSCVGDDIRGVFYTKNMESRLGEPEVSKRNQTGLWVGIYNKGLVEGRDFYGASIDIVVSDDKLHNLKNSAFITDMDACTIPETNFQVQKVLNTVEDKGLFILSLVGSNLQQLDKIFVTRMPDVVFGNASELMYLTRRATIKESLESAFQGAKLVVITQAEKGALIRFNGRLFSVPASYVPREDIIDETGAGDTYMGTMLSILMRSKIKDIRENDVIEAAQIASYTSSLVIQSMHSRLTPNMAEKVLVYEKNNR